jgi:hypothetical protein
VKSDVNTMHLSLVPSSPVTIRKTGPTRRKKSFSVRVCACACPPASRSCLSLRDQDSSEHERPRWPIGSHATGTEIIKIAAAEETPRTVE